MGLDAGLIDALAAGLREVGYIEPPREVSVHGISSAVLATPRRGTVRYLCAVFSLPDSCSTAPEARAALNRMRRALSREYARFPYWKELGTFSVLLASPALYDSVPEDLTGFIDRTGAHANTMLGAVLVDPLNRRCVSRVTWGLFVSGTHFQVIEQTVDQWLASAG